VKNTHAAEETRVVMARVCGCVRASKSMLPVDEARAWVCSRVRVARPRTRATHTGARAVFRVRIKKRVRIARVLAATVAAAAASA